MESELRDGYKMTELGALPEDWKISTLGDVCKKAINGGTPSTDIEKYWTGTIPWITGADILSQTVSKIRRYITEEAVRDSSTNVIPEGNLLIVTRTGVGKLAIAPFDVAVSQDFTGVIPKDNITTEYLFWLLNKSVNYFLNLTQGTSINGITRNDLMSFVFPLPPLPEQRHIATILSTLDETVEHTEALIQKYKNIKAGLMADLLTRGIDEDGRIRSEGTHKFKDSALGRVPVEWETTNFGNKNNFSLATGGTPSTEVDEYWDGDVPWLVSGDVHKKVVYSVEGRISKVGYKNSNATLHPKQSVLIALAGQGKTRGTVAITETKLTTNQSVAAIISKKDFVSPYYLYYLLDSKYVELRAISAGAGRAGLSLTILKDFEIKLPPLPEQRRIADILTAADQRIEKEEAYRDKLLQLKKGLMQDLLTGKVRVKDGSFQMPEQSEN